MHVTHIGSYCPNLTFYLPGAGSAFTLQYLKSKLKTRYDGKAHITDFSGKHSVFCFKGKADQFVYDSWHKERVSSDPVTDRIRVVMAAAKIINEDIRGSAFDVSSYHCGSRLDDEACVTDTLRVFLETLLPSSSEQVKRSKASLGQSIMQAARPRGYLSPIQLATGVYIHRNVGSRTLIDLLHSLGLTASYNEIQCFLFSAVMAGIPASQALADYSFIQFVFDNADYNIKTLDGHRSFHNMGGIR